MTDEERLARGAKTFKEVHGTVLNLPDKVDPDSFSGHVMRDVYNDVWARKKMTVRERRLLVLGALAAQTLPTPLEIHMKSASTWASWDRKSSRRFSISLASISVCRAPPPWSRSPTSSCRERCEVSPSAEVGLALLGERLDALGEILTGETRVDQAAVSMPRPAHPRPRGWCGSYLWPPSESAVRFPAISNASAVHAGFQIGLGDDAELTKPRRMASWECNGVPVNMSSAAFAMPTTLAPAIPLRHRARPMPTFPAGIPIWASSAGNANVGGQGHEHARCPDTSA